MGTKRRLSVVDADGVEIATGDELPPRPTVDFFTGPKPGNGTSHATTAPVAQELLALPAVRPAAWNPRQIKNAAADAELLDSVRQHGILQPVLVRPLELGQKDGARFEIVVGSRRFAAAQQAGLGAIPAVVRPLTDQEVLELQVVENSQREDVHPLEEAEAYRRLRDQHGLSAEEIAARLGKSRTWIYDRLKLAALADKPRKACLAGGLEISTALLLARLPKPLQDQALAEITAPDYEGPMSYRDARDLVATHYQCNLAEAAFDGQRVDLVAGVGACASCPKRSGNARHEYPEIDIKSPDVCTDLLCYRQKAAAWADEREAGHAAAGGVVLPAQEAAKLFSRYQPEQLDSAAPYFELDAKHYNYSTGKQTSYRKLLGKDAPVVLARDPRGNLHELVDRKLAQKAVRAAETKTTKQQAEHEEAKVTAADRAERERDQRERELETRLGRELATRIAGAAAKAKTMPDAVWRVLLRRELRDCEVTGPIAIRRGLVPADSDPARYDLGVKEIGAVVDKADGALLRSLFFELLAAAEGDWGFLQHDRSRGGVAELCRVFEVDAKAARKEIGAALQAEQRAAKLAPAAKPDPGRRGRP
jgi:ParB/RepB/Spo0J family partition protein